MLLPGDDNKCQSQRVHVFLAVIIQCENIILVVPGALRIAVNSQFDLLQRDLNIEIVAPLLI